MSRTMKLTQLNHPNNHNRNRTRAAFHLGKATIRRKIARIQRDIEAEIEEQPPTTDEHFGDDNDIEKTI
jgi:hypothetical protein